MSAKPKRPDKAASDKPSSMLEVYMAVLDGETGDPFLDEINLGTGNYSESEYWLQVEAFQKGLYADSGMVRKLMVKARGETKRRMVEAIWERPDSDELDDVDYVDPDSDDCDCDTQKEYRQEHADDIWESLGTEQWSKTQHQAWLVHEYTGIDHDWVPPHWRMLKMRHEASQSKSARALDNVFDRVREFVGQEQGPEELER